MVGILRYTLRLVIGVLAVCCTFDARAQFEQQTLSARCQAMGGASVAVRDFSGCNVNPATLGWLQRWNVAIDYRQLMLLKGMGYKSIAVGIPTGNVGAAAVYYTHFGDLTYNEQTASAHYGIRVGKGVSVGVGIYYLHSGTNDGHYEAYNSATGSVGVQYAPNEKLCFGASVFNPFFVRRDGVQRIPVQMNFGAAYKPVGSLLITAELEKNIYDPLRVRLGVEYCIIDRILVQAGVATSPMVYSIGVGYRHRHIRANLCVAVHQRMGVTPGVTLGYSF
ncbi:MAG: hypothetical protein K5867_11380 [Bacteroidales bacterium]|nr:hypothetical protein [Bacteroidales bacterium]